jgi:methionyl-tRNA formyltransferase
MNITLLGHHDIASLFALDRVISLLPQHRYSVLLSGELADAPETDRALALLTDADARLCERFLAGKAGGPVVAPLSQRPFATLTSPNSPQGLAVLKDLQPDLVISIRYRRILGEQAIAIPALGVLNLHSGILPAYRGVMATFWAMMARAKEIGSSLHRIVDSGIDTGPVIAISSRPTRLQSSYLVNLLGLYAEGCDIIVDAVDNIAAGTTPPIRQEFGHGRYFRAPDAAAVRRFESAGLTLYDGDEEAEIRPWISSTKKAPLVERGFLSRKD